MAERKIPPNLVDMLNRLEDLHVPEPVSYGPQTPGWIVLAVVIAGLAVAALWAWRRHQLANAYRGQALQWLDQLNKNGEPASIHLSEAAGILRRTALTAFPREDVASLTGEDWFAFLNRTGRAKFGPEASRILRDATYSAEPQVSSDEAGLFVRNARLWITSHKIANGGRRADA